MAFEEFDQAFHVLPRPLAFHENWPTLDGARFQFLRTEKFTHVRSALFDMSLDYKEGRTRVWGVYQKMGKFVLDPVSELVGTYETPLPIIWLITRKDINAAAGPMATFPAALLPEEAKKWVR